MQAPAIEALKRAKPDWRVTVWVAPRGTKALAESNPNIDEVIEEGIKKSPLKHASFALKLAQARYDIGIVLSPGQLWKSAAYLFLAGMPVRIGNTYPFRGLPQSNFLLTHSLNEEPSLHDIEQNLRLLGPLGISTDAAAGRSYSLQIPDDYNDHARALLSQMGIPANAYLIGLHPGSAVGYEWKRWPVDRFAKTARLLLECYQDKNPYILVFGGAEEDQIKKELCAQVGARAVAVSSNLLTVAAVIKQCKLFLTNDSGLMHLASAMDVPTYALFGPTDEKQTGPRGERSVVIRADGTVPVYHTESNHDLDPQPHHTLQEISVEQVIRAIND